MYLSKNFIIKFVILSFFFAFFIYSKSLANLVKPNNGIEPIQVVKIQLRGLKNNDNPYKDVGIEQTWEFAHPKNQKVTGPLKRFKTMIKGDSYSMLLNHIEHKVEQTFISEDKASFEVTVLDEKKRYYKFKWMVEKYLKDGPLKDCWLTTVVSQPVSLGSSI